jgi:hypothetical protein
MPLVAEALDRQAQFEAQFREIVTADITQFAVLEIVPDSFVRIQFGRVAGELLEVQPRGSPLRQEVAYDLRAVDRGSIPNDQQLAGLVAQQVLQEADDIRTAERTLLHLQEQPSGVGEPADRGQMVMGERRVQQGRLAPRSVGADDAGQRVEGRLVYPDERALLALSFAFSAGQRSAVQARMASSSRWVARKPGFWTLQPHARRRRLTCAAW